MLNFLDKGIRPWLDCYLDHNNFQIKASNSFYFVGKPLIFSGETNYALLFVNMHQGDEVTMVGHSKGGAEALANALATGTNAIVFNPAVPSFPDYGLSDEGYFGNLMVYYVEGEILHMTVGTIKYVDYSVLYLDNKYEYSSWNLWKNLKSSVKNHGMDAVIWGLQKLVE